MSKQISRRKVLGGASAVAAAGALQGGSVRASARADEKLAVLGGTPLRTSAFPSWPVIAENDESSWTAVLKSKRWFRYSGTHVKTFEEAWAKQLGSRHALAVSSGTTALLTSLSALEVGPGDEVIVPPYTFLATVNAVLLKHALPVFVDSDLETFQMDPGKIEAALTSRTTCIIPVHIGGSAADLDAILPIGKRREIPVLEDTCQSHMAEWRGKKLGTLGDLGTFSFQATKNLNSAEGGAITTQRSDLYERCMAFQNQGLAPVGSTHVTPAAGCNLRMTEFQGALLLTQLTRLEEQSRVREQNAAYLTGMLREIPGIKPDRMYDGCTRNAYHLYMFRYEKEHFAGVPRDRFLQSLRAEGVPCSSGYAPRLNKQPFITNTLASRAFKVIYTAKRLADWEERNQCPVNDRLCAEAVWFTQNLLLGTRSDMEQIAAAVRKIQGQASQLKAG